MEITHYHAKYYAHILKRRSPSDSPEKLGSSLLNATVDLNPHQIDAALFAFRSPLSRGAVLADEVGLGKTIEAGLIVSQLWAERRRRILVVVPTTLRNQWMQELEEKFFIPSTVLDTPTLRSRLEAGSDPFRDDSVVIVCSYHFARSQAAAVEAVPWDLVVVDEAHRLRNVYKPGNKIARSLRDAFRGKPKVLLTATPLQNTLLELFGLMSFLDEHLFGDVGSFRAAYMRGDLAERQFQDLRRRLTPVCKRTLRRQVTEYVRYTQRIPITQDFTPTDEERRLYDGVTAYLQRDRLHALPSRQRQLMTLVLRRLLASSSFAIAGTLSGLLSRLDGARARLEGQEPEDDLDGYAALVEEWAELEEDSTPEPYAEAADRAEILSEIEELARYRDLATSITRNAKGQALLVALKAGFEKLSELGAQRKAVVFTESRRTQAYLLDLLEANGYAGEVMTLNGTNTDARSRDILERWRHSAAESGRATGNRTVDLRTALVEHFRDRTRILVATEAAAEGVNLQFCSLVVNYDLPWNPQRVEQRIGRCHRYGQKHDVVVINFLNRSNEADRRVFQILSEKFQLFDGVFGASDEVLGALESGVDFERRIATIYQSCRTPQQIDAAFDSLQHEMEDDITVRLASTRAQLLENFDEDVHERLRLNLRETQHQLDRLSRDLWHLTCHELSDVAAFDHEEMAFVLSAEGCDAQAGIAAGRYHLLSPGRSRPAEQAYRPGHPLAQRLLERAADRSLPDGWVTFDYSSHPGRISVVEALRGRSGYLSADLVSIDALEREEHIVLAGVTDSGERLDEDTCDRLLHVAGRAGNEGALTGEARDALTLAASAEREALLARAADRNQRYFVDEMEKLERWADDLKAGLEQDIKDLETEIRMAKREARLQASLEAKVAAQRRVRELEAERNRRRRSLFEAQDAIDSRKESVLSAVEARLAQRVRTEPLFTIRWQVR